MLEFEIEGENLNSLMKMQYINELQEIDTVKLNEKGELILNINSNGKWITSKFNNWSYEEEVRRIIIDDTGLLTGKYADYPGKLIGVYFGKNTPTEDIELVKTILRGKKQIEYYQMGLNTNTMHMNTVT